MAELPSLDEQIAQLKLALHELRTGKVQSYSIGGRSLTYHDIPTLRAELEALLREKAAESGDSGARSYAGFGCP